MSTTDPIFIQYSPGADPDLPLPRYETSGAAGVDLRANFDLDLRDSGLTITPGKRALIPAGFAMAVPQGLEAQIRPRSGLALKHGVTLVNTPGTIDSDYRGPIGIILINHGQVDFKVNHGDRIAQMVIAAVLRCRFDLVDALEETTRGVDGFGSTGRG